MKKDTLREEIISLFKKKIGWKTQTIRDNISRFKIKECPHTTQNAAAHVLALTKKFSCRKLLKKEDLITIPQNIADILNRYATKSKKEAKTGYSVKEFKDKIKNSRDPLERDAWKNAAIYPKMFMLENTLRNLILKQLGDNKSWWKTPDVTQGVIDYAQNIMNDEEKTPWVDKRGNHPIYYITLKHLCKIIQINWNKFKKLGDQSIFLARIKDLFPIRHGLAHHIPLTERDKKEVDVSVYKIRKLIKVTYGV